MDSAAKSAERQEKMEVTDAFDHAMADAYDEARSRYPHWQAEDDFVRDHLAARRPRSLLDAPIGTGRFLPYYAGIERVVGIDISAEMLAHARAKLQTLPTVDANVRLEQGDMRAMPFADREFETVLVFRLFHLLPDRDLPPIVAELCRVADREIVAHSYAAAGLLRTLWRRAQSRLRRILGRQRQESLPSMNVAGRHMYVYFRRQAALDALFRAHGFTPVRSATLGQYRAADVRITVYVRGNQISSS